MTDYFVNPSTGSDSNNGLSSANAWLTTDHAGNNSASGDNVYLEAGTYNWDAAGYGNMQGDRNWIGAKSTDATIDVARDRYLTIFNGAAAQIQEFQLCQQSTTTTYTGIRWTNATSPSGSSIRTMFEVRTGNTGSITLTDVYFDDLEITGEASAVGYRGGLFGTDASNPESFHTVQVFDRCTFDDIKTLSGETATYMWSDIKRSTSTGSTSVTLRSCTFILNTTSGQTLSAMFSNYLFGDPTKYLVVMEDVVFKADLSSMNIESNAGKIGFTLSNSCTNNLVLGANTVSGNHVTADPEFVNETRRNLDPRPGSPCYATGGLY